MTVLYGIIVCRCLVTNSHWKVDILIQNRESRRTVNSLTVQVI